MKFVSPHVNQNRNGNGNGNGRRKGKGKDVVSQVAHPEPKEGGKLIVLTAPLTEAIDHAGYFIQMAMASLPIWMEGVINKKYPKWRDLEKNEDSSARYMPAGVRLVEFFGLERVINRRVQVNTDESRSIRVLVPK
jgi:hypothetical protein